MSAAKSNKERQEEFKTRQDQKGLVRLELWVPSELKAQIKWYVALKVAQHLRKPE